MKYDLSIFEELNLFNTRLQALKSKGSVIELKEVRGKRTIAQNAAIHLYCTMIADILNETGQTFTFEGLKGFDIELKYTQTIIKETVWKPIQMTMFNKESTTELTTKEVSEIAFIIEAHFSKMGFDLPFPKKK